MVPAASPSRLKDLFSHLPVVDEKTLRMYGDGGHSDTSKALATRLTLAGRTRGFFFFSLEYAGELRIFVLIGRKRCVLQRAMPRHAQQQIRSRYYRNR